MSEEEIIELLKTRLSINVETESSYTGGDPLYVDIKTVQLLLDGEVISEDYIN